MLSEQEVHRRIQESAAIRRWYQSVPYGKITPPTHFDDGKTHPDSYGEGRYQHYVKRCLAWINERLTLRDGVFCEVGCSAGLFPLRAWQDFGLRAVLGVEAAPGGFAQLCLTRDYYDKLPLKVYRASIGPMEPNINNPDTQMLDVAAFPAVCVTLLSCVHYHLRRAAFQAYLDSLDSMYLVILTEEGTHDITSGESKDIPESRQWQIVYRIETQTDWLTTKDGHKNITALIYRSPMERLNVEECFSDQLRANEFNKRFYTDIFPPFIDDVLAGRIQEVDLDKTEVYHWQVEPKYGSTPWRPEVAMQRVRSYYHLVRSIADHGQEQPIMLLATRVDRWDGHHRIAVLRHLGVPYVYARQLT